MVIERTDRVSRVLARDEGLIDVFVSLSPAFERLRNPAMRRVMSRLVTVEQAARMAGVDADDLVRRLNAGLHPAAGPETRPPGPGDGLREDGPGAGGEGVPGTPPDTTGSAPGRPAALEAVPDERIVEVDVRDDLRKGREPFRRIMEARRRVPEGGALLLRAIFEPVPLYAVMEKQGLRHHTEEVGPEDWKVWFYPPDPENWEEGGDPELAPTAQDAEASPPPDDRPGTDDAGVVVLDVRGLEPPEPMVRTLAALDTLPPGGTLVQINVRVPRFLLPRLDERGFTWETREQGPDLVRVFIRRADEEADDGPAP